MLDDVALRVEVERLLRAGDLQLQAGLGMAARVVKLASIEMTVSERVPRHDFQVDHFPRAFVIICSTDIPRQLQDLRARLECLTQPAAQEVVGPEAPQSAEIDVRTAELEPAPARALHFA